MDTERFMAEKFGDRTEVVPVPELQHWFGEDEKAEWIIRGITAHELALVNNEIAANAGKEKIMQALIGGGKNSEQIDAIRASLNIIKLSDNVPEDLCRRQATIVMGSVNPKCNDEMAIKLGLNFPTIYLQLSQKIFALTGLGRVGESMPCGEQVK